MADLDAPRTADELYLARGSEVAPFRPIATGDVFRDIRIPGVSDTPSLAIVISHPCSMRKGAHLRSHVQMAAVQRGGPIDLVHWDGNFGVMPLPELQEADDFRDRGVFELAGRVTADALTPERRIACLDTKGVLLQFQRHAFHWTRVAIDLDALLESIDHVLQELDLLEEWLPARLPASPAADLEQAVRENEATFDTIMRRESAGMTLRDALSDPKHRASVRRAVRRELS